MEMPSHVSWTGVELCTSLELDALEAALPLVKTPRPELQNLTDKPGKHREESLLLPPQDVETEGRASAKLPQLHLTIPQNPGRSVQPLAFTTVTRPLGNLLRAQSMPDISKPHTSFDEPLDISTNIGSSALTNIPPASKKRRREDEYDVDTPPAQRGKRRRYSASN